MRVHLSIWPANASAVGSRSIGSGTIGLSKKYMIRAGDANKAIEAFKRSASPARLQSAQNELKWFQLTKKRHEKEPKVKEMNEEEKKKIEKEGK
jgi:hypothetical protein